MPALTRWPRLLTKTAITACLLTGGLHVPALAQADSTQHRPLFARLPLDTLLRRGHGLYRTVRVQADSLRRQPAVRHLALPALLLGTGVVLRGEVELFDMEAEPDYLVRSGARRHLSWVRTHLDDHLRYVPGYTALGLGLVGVRGRHSLPNQAIMYGLIYYLNDGLTSNLKRLTRVQRPNGQSFNSFPSSHTSTAFAAAHFMHKEYGHRSIWYSVGAYSVAVATGGLRIAKDNHWSSDVVAGAGVGILSTELVYWAYPTLQRTATRLWQHWRPGTASPTSRTQIMVMPFYAHGAVGAALSLTVR
ncbi:phosphatase PAP2 family protein [Hymenobacter gummosus]|uniref:Phosphatase PAP2 family protein n=1 Tax=Hymenobacter gummosus TaxID=1776032 RepID=A0A3S0K8G2_9BACT|nr:phosphatase PAP2 family protein [Hymenobacter gummosus]RTQ53318.1 phosphatase PAP2 family protein [Hymenobacter gummosus]